MEKIISSVGHPCPTQGQGCPAIGGCEACENALRNDLPVALAAGDGAPEMCPTCGERSYAHHWCCNCGHTG